MTVIGIDPGPVESAYVAWDGQRVIGIDHGGTRIIGHDILRNDILRTVLGEAGQVAVVWERIESYGMAVGADIFATVFESGRMFEACRSARRDSIGRRAVKLHLCGSARAKDANIRQALIDKIGPVGLKRKPGPLYGIRTHEWAALAVAVTWLDQHAGESR